MLQIARIRHRSLLEYLETLSEIHLMNRMTLSHTLVSQTILYMEQKKIRVVDLQIIIGL